MEIKGKVIQLLALQTGEGKNGTWRKQEFIIETDAQYPKKVCISAWGDKINEQLLQVGSDINVSFDVESREYNGRWYTDVKAWRIEPATNALADTNESYRATPPPLAPLTNDLASDDADNLPF